MLQLYKRLRNSPKVFHSVFAGVHLAGGLFCLVLLLLNVGGVGYHVKKVLNSL